MHKIIVKASRILFGMVFIFSGFVKGIDVLGFNYKMVDYLESFHLDFLQFTTLPASFILPFLEFAIGAALLTGICVRLASVLGFIFMAFFTILTAYIWKYNPVQDCGCFGDALIISNKATFLKNVFLMTLAIIIFKNRNITYTNSLPARKGLFWGLNFVMVLVMYFSYSYLPILDFRPFKEGANIPEAMKIPEGAPQDVYENVYYYKNIKSGELEEFNDNNYPWQDTINYVFDHMDEPRLLKKGFTPSIDDFRVENRDNQDVSSFFLTNPEYSFLWVSYNMNKADQDAFEASERVAKWAKENNISFTGLTSTDIATVDQMKEAHQMTFDILNADETMLKTVVRANPGLLLMKNGTVIKKWNANHLPETFSLELLKQLEDDLNK
ncbi:DoxX family protein [Halosquirtibacter xylanolyticus]|uniref:BT_3928 family protein n=1 Tax=Halosquirtibacter xylanolyticus TaxID=3374599 RepID=UPI00374800F9|nr:DoxX family protein [Prolixibacteraceae bacterium]